MNVVIVLRKRITDPRDFDETVEAVKTAVKNLAFDSVRSNFTYDPDDRQDGDIAFTGKD